ncbi:sensor domain-containing diguanylate cyclase [Methylobacillus arboreus]|uniref:sensor domain-containing diguanylate cyclase n=1 Tax=Methylobacillus arboreus TaxID=755170 RepID=UPI001E63661A|nr:sensor domain-containing diguanylate cyclase [Methylobacillus arboreus]MCB5190441.1 sensor domain-containing diguanylate cyclase [Methylobacillus arboreus]
MISQLKLESYQLEALLESLPIPISCASLQGGKILFMNGKFRDTYGYRVSDFASVEEWIKRAYPLDGQRIAARERWSAYFAGSSRQVYEVPPIEVNIKCADGSIKTALHGGVILPDAGLGLATFIDITEHKRDEATLKALAEKDALTGLLNRRAFDFYLEHLTQKAAEENQMLLLILLDLDRFKAINDTYGHQTGDLVLKHVGVVLSACVRSSDYLARFGGDEFGIIAPNITTKKTAERLCSKIIDMLDQPFDIGPDHAYRINTSIGFAIYPLAATSCQQLFKKADEALYLSKSSGRGMWTAAKEQG